MHNCYTSVDSTLEGDEAAWAAVQRMLGGDHDDAAWDELLRYIAPRVCHVCRGRLPPGGGLDDAIQSSMATIARGLVGREFVDQDHFFGWICRVADHTAIDHHRREVRRQRRQRRLPQAAAEQPAPEDYGDLFSGMLDAVKRSMEQLSERQRQVVSMRFCEGLDYRDIAQQLGISVQHAMSASHKGLKKLRRRLRGTAACSVVLWWQIGQEMSWSTGTAAAAASTRQRIGFWPGPAIATALATLTVICGTSAVWMAFGGQPGEPGQHAFLVDWVGAGGQLNGQALGEVPRGREYALAVGDHLLSGGADLHCRLVGGGSLEVRPGSRVKVVDHGWELLYGGYRLTTKPQCGGISLTTPHGAVLVPAGTGEMLVCVGDRVTRVDVVSGAVQVTDRGGTDPPLPGLTVSQGQGVVLGTSTAPVPVASFGREYAPEDGARFFREAHSRYRVGRPVLTKAVIRAMTGQDGEWRALEPAVHADMPNVHDRRIEGGGTYRLDSRGAERSFTPFLASPLGAGAVIRCTASLRGLPGGPPTINFGFVGRLLAIPSAEAAAPLFASQPAPVFAEDRPWEIIVHLVRVGSDHTGCGIFEVCFNFIDQRLLVLDRDLTYGPISRNAEIRMQAPEIRLLSSVP